MPHFGMHQTVKHASIHDGAAADARAHGQVNKVGKILGRSPARFAQGGGIHIGIESNRHAERVAHGSGEIVILPTCLRGRGDVPKGERSAVQINRPERSDADRLQFAPGFAAQKLNRLGQRGVGHGGGKLNRLQIVRSGSHAANEFCSASLDRTKHIWA